MTKYTLKHRLLQWWCALRNIKQKEGIIVGKFQRYYYCQRFETCVCKNRQSLKTKFCNHCDPRCCAKSYSITRYNDFFEGKESE